MAKRTTTPRRKKTKSASDDITKIMLVIVQQVQNHGWTEAALQHGADAAGITRGALRLHFPQGVRDVVAAFSAWANAEMVAAIQSVKHFERWRVRDKVAFGVQVRLKALTPYRTAVAALLPWAALPLHTPFALQQLYKTTDAIWREAGDQSTDFNFYTKRGLLAFVLKTTTYFWLHDKSSGQEASWKFLERRIAEVLKLGQTIGTVKNLDVFGIVANFIKRAA
jgi:ubiquinone biosynthesis protein COQ9